MEGNACYKFSTIRHYLEKTGGKAIKLIVDVGANVGNICMMMHHYFPTAEIHGFEAVREYFELARQNTEDIRNIRIYYLAVTAEHLFADDLGLAPRKENTGLRVLKGLPEAGPGWGGGSIIVPSDHEIVRCGVAIFGYELNDERPKALSLDQLITELLAKNDHDEVDILKMDCEGCEHSALGCSQIDTLRRIRFIVGEYHNIARFYQVIKHKLFITHKVNLIGTRELGCFFAERREGYKDGILKSDKTGMLILRPWLAGSALDWHLFNDEFVLPEDRAWHALP